MNRLPNRGRGRGNSPRGRGNGRGNKSRVTHVDIEAHLKAQAAQSPALQDAASSSKDPQ